MVEIKPRHREILFCSRSYHLSCIYWV